VAERFSFSKSTRRDVEVEVEGGAVSVRGERTTLPRVKPEPTWCVTEIILPVKRRMPCSDSRSGGIGSTFRAREMAIERPIFHAGGHCQY
jgi:hypothetical protein